MSSNSYTDRLLAPKELGVSDEGKMKYLVGDIKALLNYVDVLISDGPWKGLNKSNIPIGSAQFLPTNTKCSNADTTVGENIDRYIYHNSVPTGDNKSLMSSLSYDISNLETDASNLVNVFSKNSGNKCKKIKAICIEPDGSLPKDKDIIKDSDGNGYLERAINIDEIESIDPCMFYPENNKRVNPVTGDTCKEGFSVFNLNTNTDTAKYCVHAFTIIIIILCILYVCGFSRYSK